MTLVTLTRADPAHADEAVEGDRRRVAIVISAALDGQLALPDCRAGAPRGRTLGHLAASVAEARSAAENDSRAVLAVLHLGDVVGVGALSRFLLARPGGEERLTALVGRAGFTHALQGKHWYSLKPPVLSALVKGLAASGVEFLSANVSCTGRADCESLSTTPGHAAFEDSGVVMALVGETGESVLQAVDAKALEGLGFTPAGASLAVEAKALREQGAHVVIGALHENGLARGFSEFEAAMHGLEGVDLLLVNELGAFRSSSGVLARPGEAPVVLSGRTPTEAVRVDFDVVRRGEAWRVEDVRTTRHTATTPDAGLTTELNALHAEFCAAENSPLPVRADPPVDQAAFLDTLLDAVRTGTQSEVAIVNEGLVASAAFPLEGAISTADLFTAIRWDDAVHVASLDGARLRTLWIANNAAIAAGRPGLAFAGIDVHEESLRVNGRPLEEESPYRVALPDFLARGGDGWFDAPVDDEAALGPEGEPHTYRELLAAHATRAAPGTALTALERPALERHFRWSWSSMLSGTLTNSAGNHRTAYVDRRLDRDPGTVLGLEASGRVDGDELDHALRLSGRIRYYSALVGDASYEIEDSAFVEALYRLRAPSRWLDEAWYAPIPYASVSLDTEFVPPDPTVQPQYPYRFFDLAGAVGARFVPIRPLELKLGAGWRRQVLDPDAAHRFGVVAGFDLPRFTATTFAGAPVDLESAFDWFTAPSTNGLRHEGRLRLRVLMPLVGWLGVAGGLDLISLADGPGPLAVYSEASLYLTVRVLGARQW